jgi:hypothetical protein
LLQRRPEKLNTLEIEKKEDEKERREGRSDSR